MSPEKYPKIDATLVTDFLQANQHLLRIIRESLDKFDKHPRTDQEKAAHVWKNRVVSTLSADYAELESAAHKFDRGEKDPVLSAANDKLSLSKDLDNFSLDWAAPSDAKDIREAIAKIVLGARQLYDLSKS